MPSSLLALILQSEYHSILQVSKLKDSVPALDGQYSDRKMMHPIAARRCAPCVTTKKGGVVVIGKSAALTFVDKLDGHSPGAGFVGDFSGLWALHLSFRYTQNLFG